MTETTSNPTRRDLLATSATAGLGLALAQPAKAAETPRLAVPHGPGAASGAPHLPAWFSDTFTSRFVETGSCTR